MKLLEQLMVKFCLIPYRWGGDDFTGFDCSGVVQELLASVGADLPGDQSAAALHDHFSKPANHISREPQLGALVFYGSSTKIIHVAMAYSKRLMFEEGGGGSNVSTVDAAAKANAYGRFRPIRFGKDLQGIYMPDYGPFIETP